MGSDVEKAIIGSAVNRGVKVDSALRCCRASERARTYSSFAFQADGRTN